MIFFDTNVLVYASVNQDERKLQKSQTIIAKAQENEELLLSSLLIQEYVFVLKKLKNEQINILENAETFSKYCKYQIDCALLKDALELASNIDYFQNINDIIHLKFADKYANKLVTFDKDFEKLQSYTDIEIEILR